MLMMNQPGGQPGVPQGAFPPARPPGAVPPTGAGHIASKLKGTMVGVAPMGIGGTPAPAPAGGGTSPMPSPPGAVPGATGEGPSAFSPPIPQRGVNPLGGTVAADAGVYGAFAAHQQPTPGGGGGGPAPYGAPPGQQGPYSSAGFPPFAVPPPPGAPPHGGSRPQGQGGGDWQGQEPSAGYGQPMMGQGMAPYSQPPGDHMAGTLKSQAGTSIGPTRRNALLTILLPAALMMGGMILSIVLAFAVSPGLGSLGGLFVLAGGIWYLFLAVQMLAELKAVTRSEELAWWPLIVPFYQLYFMWVVVPKEVAKAKQTLGANANPQPVLLYVFLWHFALASDLNDMVR